LAKVSQEKKWESGVRGKSYFNPEGEGEIDEYGRDRGRNGSQKFTPLEGGGGAEVRSLEQGMSKKELTLAIGGVIWGAVVVQKEGKKDVVSHFSVKPSEGVEEEVQERKKGRLEFGLVDNVEG